MLAAGQIGLNPNMGDDLIMPSFIAIIVGGVGSLTGTLLGGLLIGVAAALTTVVLPGRRRGGDLRHHGDRPAGPAARTARRGRDADMSSVTDAARRRPSRGPGCSCAIIWALLLTVPLWLPLLGGYTAIAGRVLVFALAAMSLNMLLGYTGVLSFGHAAYFGLGAYGAGLCLKYVAASTPLAMLAGTLLGGIAGTLFGLLLVRRRGVYFAMVTIAFGQVCFYIAYKWDDFTGGYDGLRGFARAPLDFGLFKIDIAEQRHAVLLLRPVRLRPGRRPAGADPEVAVRPHHAGDPRERAARALPRPAGRAAYLAVASRSRASSPALAGSLYALLNNFADPLGLNYVMSGNIVMIAVMGGMRTFWGPLVGAVLFVMLQDYVSSMTTNWMFFVGTTFVLVVLFFPRGLMGVLQKRAGA